MSTFIPDSCIRCENCHESFYQYVVITNVIDTDKNDILAHDALSGNLNRVTCPFCKSEFTYENPLLLYSHTFKIAVMAAYTDLPMNTKDFSLAVRIAGCTDWTLRLCEFACNASEKIRIFKAGLDDRIIETIKIRLFDEYKDMELDEEYIVFEKVDSNYLYFTKRNDCDIIMDNYKISAEIYNNFETDSQSPTGNWITINRDWAKTHMEEQI